ncbi:hypothetical protein [Aquimarina hainanensis]
MKKMLKRKHLSSSPLFSLPPLVYGYDAFTDVIDAQTMGNPSF